MNKTVVITGASTGIGAATVKTISEAGWQVFAGVRRIEDAPKLPNVVPLLLDVTDRARIQRAVENVRLSLGNTNLGGLVNNAGIALGGPLAFQPIDELRQTMEVNFFGAVQVTQAFLPLLGLDPKREGAPGRIVNMSSVAGGIGHPFLGGYAASKHALEGFSESLRRELMLFGIDVVVIGPGSVATPIWDKAETKGMDGYDDTAYALSLKAAMKVILSSGRGGISAESVASLVVEALSSSAPKVRYAPVQGKFVNWVLPRLLPKRFVDRVIARSLGLVVGKKG